MKRPWHPLPAEVYALVERTPATVLLECSHPAAADPITRLFVSPLQVLTAREPAGLPELFEAVESATGNGHFAAGFFSYECGQAFEPKSTAQPPTHNRVSSPAQDPSQPTAQPRTQPLAWIGLFDRCHLFHHSTGAFLDGDPPEITRTLSPAAHQGASPHETPQTTPIEPAFDLTEPQYAGRIERIHQWIRAGDVYQLNFTFSLRARISSSPAALYARLRCCQPVEYGAFIHWQSGRHILSFSPELFFRIEERDQTRRIATRPMKGTAPRGRTTAEDRRIAQWLRTDPKNRSENVMIVDLLRNDLGRLCTYGSVCVEGLFSVQRYPSLWQMTSAIAGTLRPEVGFHEIFRALFPCGSVTGAPKVHAMQLLAEIEDGPRGIYTGAIGFFSKRQTIFNVAIRTLELERDTGEHGSKNARMGIGSGIVIDSQPASEYRECQLKAEFLTRTVEPFSLIETLLWQGEYPLIELHLDRLEDSANYFGFECDRKEVKTALADLASAFPDHAPRKVRLLLDRDGSFQMEHEALPPETTTRSQCGRVCIARQPTDPADRMLFHKTTNRPLYARAFKAATQAGFDDMLFFNQQGQLTEGAISNIFIERKGRWFTPPIECGLLPGVYRRHLLETQPAIEQRILNLADLQSADAVYLTNAVRGLRRVTTDWEK